MSEPYPYQPGRSGSGTNPYNMDHILNDKIKMLRSTLSYLSFGLVSESVESEVAEVPVPEVESKVEVTSPVEDNWVILGQDLTVSLILPPILYS